MGRIIYTISVPEHSIADAKLKLWKENGTNISASVCMLIERGGVEVDRLEQLKRKIRTLKTMTDDKKLTKEEWELQFGLW
jgi:hypothetical protein